jgi:hypothetical protein
MSKGLKPGYHIFTAIAVEEKGIEAAAEKLQAKINEAEKTFDIEFIGGANFKDDGGASRNTYFGTQAAVLTRKK